MIASITFAQQSRLARVTRVIDGDTFVLKSGEKIRLLGVDTPEMDSKVSTEKLHAFQAVQISKNLTEEKFVRLTTEFSLLGGEHWGGCISFHAFFFPF